MPSVLSLFFVLILVTNGNTNQSTVKVKHLKPNQVQKMVSFKKPQAMFPNTAKEYDKYDEKAIKKTNYNNDTIYLKEELLEHIDEMNEDQINLLKDADLLQTIAMTENYIANRFESNQGTEQEVSEICESNKLSKINAKSKDKL